MGANNHMSDVVLYYGRYHAPCEDKFDNLEDAVVDGLSISSSGEGYPYKITVDGQVVWEPDCAPWEKGYEFLNDAAKRLGINIDDLDDVG
jgi:hypothetical protein